MIFSLFHNPQHREERAEALVLLRKESLDIYNRLHSIAEDIKFVEDVCQSYPDLPVLPNLRCGAWYVDPKLMRHAGAYFKSTDGHTNNWSFNLRRPNLHLLSTVIHCHGIILVDSTRAGKRMPDALSKTIPIWCSVINKAIRKLYTKDADWDTHFYCPPGVVSAQEQSQIETRLDDWATSLAESSYSLPILPLPLRPMWITPSASTFPRLPPTSEAQFFPIICVSASKQIQEGIERRSQGFAYVQGSGDDHELWGLGLTPQIFWQHQDQLLSATRGTLPEVVKTLVASSPHRQHEDWLKPPTPISKVGGRLLICAIADVPSGLPPHLPNSDDRIAYVIVTNEPTAFDDAVGKDEFERKDVLVLSMQEGKRGQAQFLQTVLPRAVPFIGTYIMGGTKVCICCHNGKDASVGVALAVLQMYFDDDGRILAVKQQEDLCRHANKQSIATRLQWIISSRPEANPSRVTLKRVNEFLLTPPQFLRTILDGSSLV
ncbi:unnamed protein product [Somion occarium]|uniref:Initiator tRNA phosphoribosyl transferase n=1 Tax=Somion occarium TaxID=3059160 RepID=A0ABP1E6W2_9APHY